MRLIGHLQQAKTYQKTGDIRIQGFWGERNLSLLTIQT